MDIEEQAYIAFNSEGRLLQVEYGLVAASSSYQIVTINAGTAVIAISKKLPIPKLCVDKHTSIYKIADNIYMNITGIPADIYYVIKRAHEFAASLEYSLGCPLTPDVFARELACKFQTFVLRSGKRSPAFAAAIFGMENEKAVLHYIDMSGVEYVCTAMSSGEDFGKMNKYLDKHMKDGSVEELLDVGVSTLLEVIGKDPDYSEIEIAILSKDGLSIMPEKDIDRLLQTIAERQ